MYLCEYCGSILSASATICNRCSRVQSNSGMARDSYSAASFRDLETATVLSTPGKSDPSWNSKQDLRNSDIYSPDVIPLLNGPEEAHLDEEEIHYRTVLLDMGLTLTGNPAGDGLLLAGNASMIQNVPDALQDMPKTGGLNGKFDRPAQVFPTLQAYQQQSFLPPPISNAPNLARPANLPRYRFNPSQKRRNLQRPPYFQQPQFPIQQKKGTIPLWLIAALIIPLLMIVILLGLGRTLLRPSSAFEKGTSIVQDETTTTTPSPATAVPAGNVTPAPADTPLATPSSTDTPSPTASPTTTSGPTALSCVNPSSISLGPVSEGYNLPTSQTVTLCTTGSGKVKWAANWDHKQASWLALDSTSGQIKAPDQGRLNINATTSSLKPGNYSATVTFTSQSSSKKLFLHVSFIVQIGCITATPNALTFTSIASRSDPAPEQATINNCGAIGTWSASIFTANGKSWLSVNATQGVLNGGDSSPITISASNLNARLQPGSYSGKILLSIGSSSSTISVTLIVLPSAPK